MNFAIQPLRFDVRKLLAKARRTLNKRVSGAQIHLPGFTFSVAPVDPEVKVARQLVIWLADRRVLNAFECCDGCIDRSLVSLLKIREHLVQKQVELSELSDGVLFFLIEFMLQGLRQFLTYEEQLKRQFTGDDHSRLFPDKHRPHVLRENYFAALGVLREHLYGAIVQIAIIAKVTIPKIPDSMRVESWNPSNYAIDEHSATSESIRRDKELSSGSAVGRAHSEVMKAAQRKVRSRN